VEKKKTYFDCSASGLEVRLPEIEAWKNQFYKDYEIVIEFPEFTSVCPLTGLPDFGTIIIKYIPDKFCVEMKALKLYLNAYRNIGIFQENAVNKILKDFVKSVRPKKVQVTGVFKPRGGMSSAITAEYKKGKKIK